MPIKPDDSPLVAAQKILASFDFRDFEAECKKLAAVMERRERAAWIKALGWCTGRTAMTFGLRGVVNEEIERLQKEEADGLRAAK
jgi:hypothetical protein